MLKVIICSIVLFGCVYALQSVALAFFDASYLAGTLFCGAVLGVSLLIAAAVDRRNKALR